MSIAGEPTSVAAAASTSAETGEFNAVAELERLGRLRRSGAISEYDFNKAKFQVLERERFGQAGSADQDVIGAGRYVLSFVLAGLIGVGVAYALRNQGWLAIWINAAIFVGVVAIFLAV